MFILRYLEEWFGWSEPAKKDLILKITGSFGRYQLILFCFVCLSKFAIGFHQMAIIFLAPKVSYECPAAALRESTIPLTANKCPCDNPKYDTSEFSRTMIMEFHLICDRRWLASFSQTIFQMGTLIGSIIFGMLSDRYGRKNPFIGACIIQIIFGIAASYMKSYETFAFMRLLVGISVGGTMVVGFVLIMEFIGPEYREVVSALYQVPFNMGHMMTPMIAFYYRDFAEFQFVISVPEFILLIYFFVLPESARWLVAMKQTERAIKILTMVAKVNNRPTDYIRGDVLAYQALAERNKLTKGTIIDLFRTPNLRKNNLAMAFNWLACSYCFYGVSQYVGQLSGNVFLNVACSASVTMMGTLSSIPLLKMMGRKSILLMCHIICASCLFLLAFIPEGILSIICASVGVVFSFIVFVVVYLYSGELFPTVVRNAAIGFSSMSARIGSMIAPFIVDLKTVRAWLPPVGFAIVPFVAIFVTLLLPETKGCELMTTIEEGEKFGKKEKAEKI